MTRHPPRLVLLRRANHQAAKRNSTQHYSHLHPRQNAMQQMARNGGEPCSYGEDVWRLNPTSRNCVQIVSTNSSTLGKIKPSIRPWLALSISHRQSEPNQLGHAADVQLLHQTAAMFLNRLDTEARAFEP